MFVKICNVEKKSENVIECDSYRRESRDTSVYDFTTEKGDVIRNWGVDMNTHEVFIVSSEGKTIDRFYCHKQDSE